MISIGRTFTACVAAALVTASCGSGPAAERPRLVVVIAVDGLGTDLLDRCRPALTGGLRHLLDEGVVFTEAVVDHGITVSHAGHVTIATGRHPAGHGIVDAAFTVLGEGEPRLVDALQDPAERILDAPGAPGVSPHLIEARTFAEWVQTAEPEARVVAVGGGAHSSLLHAGRARGDVTWFDRTVGRFVTSTAYGERLPEWVDIFNRDRVGRWIERAGRWESTVPGDLGTTLVPDARPYEADGVHTTFPHLLSAEMAHEAGEPSAVAARWFTWGPFVDGAVLELAQRGIQHGRLGRRGALDVVLLVLSQTDSVCHYYGPSSHEAADTLLRLDRELGAFFGWLDAEIGRGGWLCGLTADHGMPEIPEQRAARGVPGRRLKADAIEAILEPVRARRYDRPAAAELLSRTDCIAAVYTPEELASASGGDEFLRLYRRSWRPDRVPRLPLFSLQVHDAPIAAIGLMVRLQPGTIPDLDVDNHGSPYEYDRRVPLVIFGPGVRAHSSAAAACTVDVAPTLAALAAVPAPPDLDGTVLPVR